MHLLKKKVRQIKMIDKLTLRLLKEKKTKVTLRLLNRKEESNDRNKGL